MLGGRLDSILEVFSNLCFYDSVIIELYTIEAAPNIQSHPTISPSLPIPSEELIAIRHSIPVMRVVPPFFCDGEQVIAVLLHNGFQLLLFVARATCIGVGALELGYRSHSQH